MICNFGGETQTSIQWPKNKPHDLDVRPQHSCNFLAYILIMNFSCHISPYFFCLSEMQSNIVSHITQLLVKNANVCPCKHFV